MEKEIVVVELLAKAACYEERRTEERNKTKEK
jgi:hypothetical protein